ncbi:arginine deiminase [mine drainage metagenome]|uniref:Arginine deiminase n=1 Tax=mine drainage metagenome TaxID=410659 RepID=T1AET6_9ZZZZ
MRGKIKAEWGHLAEVAVHKPGIEMFFGLLDPKASLYERIFSRHAARIEHDKLRTVLKEEFGVKVLRLDDTILNAADKSDRIRQSLIDSALTITKFGGSTGERKTIADIQTGYDTNQFLDMLILGPTMHSTGAKGIPLQHSSRISVNPLPNLYFMRDQQVTTDKGIFMSRMSSSKRRREPYVTKLFWDALGIPITDMARAPATIEGGDFMPMGDFALVGTGYRTNKEGVTQIMKHGLGFDEIGVVHQPQYPLMPGSMPDPMMDMHLDTYFNVAGSSTVVGSDMLLRRAMIDIYRKEAKGQYIKDKKTTTFYDYIKAKGFNIVDISLLEQMSYATNFLCIGDGKILAVESGKIIRSVLSTIAFKAEKNPKMYATLFAAVKKEYAKLRHSGQIFPANGDLCKNGIDVYTIDLKNLTGGYGGAHCMTAAVNRR